LAFGASTPWKRIRCSLGLCTSAASRCKNSRGDFTEQGVPSAPRGLQLEHHLSRGVGPYPIVGQRRAGDVAAQLFQRLTISCAASHGSVQAETVDVSAQCILWHFRTGDGFGLGDEGRGALVPDEIRSLCART
jgi:hypothetical protein